MFSFMNCIGQLLSGFLTVVFTALFSLSSLLGGVNQELPKTPEDFTPILRFVVCSDVHLDCTNDQNRETKFEAVFTDTYKYAAKSSYKKLDAVIVAGDFANRGRDEEYIRFNELVNKNIKPETQLLTCLGNHEFINYRDYDATIAYERYKALINENVDTHVVINGYHFIGVSYDDNGKTFKGKTEWLDTQLKEASKDTPDKPIFVYQHPHPTATVYGSINWSDVDIRAVLTKYPQVIDFSGHSHYTSTDPRCVWQGSFTAIGTGSTCALMSNLNYFGHDEDAPGDSGACWIVEVDADGNTRLQLWDLANHRFFEKNEYYFVNSTKPTDHKYTWGNLKSLDTAPQFPEGATITAERNSDGNVILGFPDATAYWGAENYKISVTKGVFKDVWSETVVSNYVRTVSDGMNVDIGNLEAGTYTVRIKPYSPYAKGGKTLKATITVE